MRCITNNMEHLDAGNSAAANNRRILSEKCNLRFCKQGINTKLLKPSTSFVFISSLSTVETLIWLM